jgi:hypothetical protein
MSLIVENVSDFQLCPPGMHLARCYRIIDLGTQREEYKGQVKSNRKVSIYWEVCPSDDNGEPVRLGDGRPFMVYRNYNLTWNEKSKLRIHLQAWRGRPFNQEEMQRFDLKNILGVWCMLTVVHNPSESGKVYANVDSVNPVPSVIKQNGLPAPTNKNEMFTIQNPDMDMFETFNESLKTKIMSSPEWQRLHAASDYQRAAIAEANAVRPPEDYEDQIPF